MNHGYPTPHPQNCKTCIFARDWNRGAYRKCASYEDVDMPQIRHLPVKFTPDLIFFIRVRGCATYIEKPTIICNAPEVWEASKQELRCKYRDYRTCRAEPNKIESCQYAKPSDAP